MSILLAVVAAVGAVTLTTYYSQRSALALGKVSAMVSATAVVADAWSKVQEISKRLSASPTQVMLPNVTQQPTSREVVRQELDDDNDFYRENPSLGLTGGIRGYSAYRRP